MLFLALVALLLSASPAAAEPTDGAQTRAICAATDGTADYQYLPVERWSGATQQLHVRSAGGFPTDFAPLQRQLQGSTFVIGDFLYSVTTKLVMWSTEFCPLQSVGATIDSAAAQFGRSVLSSPLLAGLAVIATAGLLLQGLRREGSWLARLAVKMVIVGALVVMVVGATNSRTDEAGRFIPGEGSPGWFATTIDEAITEIASAPAAALSTPNSDEGAGIDTDQLSCGAYINALRRGYNDSARDDGTLIDAKSVPAQTISNLWQVSGYRAWSVGQFGRDNLNGQSRVACRMLDHNAAIPAGIGSYTIEGQGAENNRSAATRADVLSRVPDPRIAVSQVGVNPNAPAWRPLNRVEQDKAWIAWASCVPQDGLLSNIDATGGWHTPRGQGWLIAVEAARVGAEEGRSAALNSACYNFFNRNGDTVGDIFDWGDGDAKLKENAGEMPASIYDFISSLHGSNLGASGSAVIGYLLSAIGVAAVFGMAGAIIMIIKAIAAFMLLSVIFVALLCLLPRTDNNRLIRFIKGYVGLSLAAAFGVFILSLITLFTNVILNVIKGFVGQNTDMGLILGGLAPVMAAVALHFAFRQAGVPSPMTLKGAMSFGGAIAGGAGLNAIRQGGQQMLSSAKDMVNRGRERLPGADGDASRASQLGKRNADLNTEQPLRPRTADSGPTGPTPEDILNDPNSTLRQRRAAARQRMADIDGLREDQKASRREEAQQERAARQARISGAVESTRSQRMIDRGKEVGSAVAGLGSAAAGAVGAVGARIAGAAPAPVRRFGRWSADQARVQAGVWGHRFRQDPGRAIGRATKTMALAGGALLLGAPAGLVGGAVAGVVVARRASSAIQRRRRSHAGVRQQQLRDYRSRAYARQQLEAEFKSFSAGGASGGVRGGAPAGPARRARSAPTGASAPARAETGSGTWPGNESRAEQLSRSGERGHL
ncbi:hypothetical protein [Microlunatus speluncae]|uniref:hypothetical protein n=1 Tax=Microlunatus speluncae TaxID=2594267 RepID=UPI001266326C|nr:hypothetical protein [Microlunatus speluncae]